MFLVEVDVFVVEVDVFVVDPHLWQDSDDMITANLTEFNLTSLSCLQTSIVSWNRIQ